MAISPPSRLESRNAILSRCNSDEFADLHRNLNLIDLPIRHVLYEPNQPIEHAYFVETGMVSVVAQMLDGNSIEVGTVGREGILGGILLLGIRRNSTRCFTQIAGQAHRIDTATLLREAERHPELRRLILRYESLLLTQSMQGVACNGLHNVHQRCCRWILMACDRCGSKDIPLTHEFLALMLGALRASVTDVLGPLQDAKLITSVRGHIKILDAEGLEKGACECYRIVADQERAMLED